MSEFTFKRIERKFVITKEQKEKFLEDILDFISFDPFCRNGETYFVENIYYDTKNNSLISKSIQKPNYKIKMRIRHYLNNELYFLELKQKTNGVVSKRRIALTKNEFILFFTKGELPIRKSFLDNQIIKEFTYFLEKNTLFPALYLSYNRIAFFAKEDKNLRLTLDNNIKGSRKNIDFEQNNKEENILDNNSYILEIKYSQNYPFWLIKALNDNHIYHSSFSKYGEEYKKYILKGGIYESI